MPKIFDIDVPDGLVYLFYGLFGYPNSTTTDYLRTNNIAVSRARRVRLTNKTYLIYFASIFNPLSTARHNAWQDYWATLPFGSHAGSRGYPGSGFSAFVYVNAPRYKLGLELLLDPPASNLFTNPGFVGGLDPDWGYSEYVSWISDGFVEMAAVTHDSWIFQDVPVTVLTNYRMTVHFELYDEFDMLMDSETLADFEVTFVYNDGANEDIIFADDVAGPSFTFDFETPDFDTGGEIWLYHNHDSSAYARISYMELVPI